MSQSSIYSPPVFPRGIDCEPQELPGFPTLNTRLEQRFIVNEVLTMVHVWYSRNMRALRKQQKFFPILEYI